MKSIHCYAYGGHQKMCKKRLIFAATTLHPKGALTSHFGMQKKKNQVYVLEDAKASIGTITIFT